MLIYFIAITQPKICFVWQAACYCWQLTRLACYFIMCCGQWEEKPGVLGPGKQAGNGSDREYVEWCGFKMKIPQWTGSTETNLTPWFKIWNLEVFIYLNNLVWSMCLKAHIHGNKCILNLSRKCALFHGTSILHDDLALLGAGTPSIIKDASDVDHFKCLYKKWFFKWCRGL